MEKYWPALGSRTKPQRYYADRWPRHRACNVTLENLRTAVVGLVLASSGDQEHFYGSKSAVDERGRVWNAEACASKEVEGKEGSGREMMHVMPCIGRPPAGVV